MVKDNRGEHRYTLRFSEHSGNYIKKFKEKNDLKHTSKAIERIIFEHELMKNYTENLIGFIRQEIRAEFEDDFKKLSIGINSVDKVNKINHEVLNKMALVDEDVRGRCYEEIKSSKVEKSETVRVAEQNISDEIQQMKNEKLRLLSNIVD